MENEIGEAAGKIWQTLKVKGELTKSRLAKETGLGTELLDRGIGWLAREGKLVPNGTGRKQSLAARD